MASTIWRFQCTSRRSHGREHEAPGPGERRLAHECVIDVSRGLAPFVQGPHDQRLPATAIARREDLRARGCVFVGRGFDVRTRVRVECELFDRGLQGPRLVSMSSEHLHLFRAEEAHCQEHEIARVDAFGSRDLRHLPTTAVVVLFLPFHAHRANPRHATVAVAHEFLQMHPLRVTFLSLARGYGIRVSACM